MTEDDRTLDWRRDWRHLLSVGGLVGAVLFVLVLGAVLQTDSGERPALSTTAETLPPLPPPSRGLDTEPRGMQPEALPPHDVPRPARAAPLPVAPTPRAEDPQPAPAPEVRGRLARRVDHDLGRMGRTGWTLQLAAVCEPANALRLVDRYEGHEELHLLPMTYRDRPCIRVVWGRFPSRDEAVGSASGLPRAVRSEFSRPQPRSLTGILP